MDFITHRKYPFIVALLLLLLTVVVFLLSSTSTDTSTIVSYFQAQPQNATVSLSPPPLIRDTDTDTSSTDTNQNAAAPPPLITNETTDQNDNSSNAVGDDAAFDLIKWDVCTGPMAVDYIPCLDNVEAVKKLPSIRHMEHRERHCPSPSPRCLAPLPVGYKLPVLWPKSKDMIWYNNVPHPKLVEYKKDQNWVRKSGDYFVFPGGGTQFKEGVSRYVGFVEKTLPKIKWGKNIRVILDVGCGVASFGGYLLDRDVITMSLAPKDEHEAQIQFALERGIPAILSVIGTQKLTFPDDAYDLIHCARCRVHWDAQGGKPLLELNRILRPGGFFIWSATPVYRHDDRHRSVWNAMVNLTESMCWKAVARYVPLSNCISRLPTDSKGNLHSWPTPWPQRLSSKPPSLPPDSEEAFNKDTTHWYALVSDVYVGGLAINWSSVRNVMDMNASYGGFAAALIDQPLWVMNVVPIDAPDTLSIIFDRGLIGMYHDWCESFNTYPRTYDLLHSSFLLSDVTQRCDIADVAVEMDRILRPGGYVLVQDTLEMINKLKPVLHSLQWSTNIYHDQFLVGKKGFWRPTGGET
ncbi:putative methyltransferase PMT23 [Citrus sinensis]|nr:putative methyltransferase PMT23 [Citrus sinensis]